MFPKIVVPPNHPISIGFSIINHPFWGTPIFGNTHIDPLSEATVYGMDLVNLPVMFIYIFPFLLRDCCWSFWEAWIVIITC